MFTGKIGPILVMLLSLVTVSMLVATAACAPAPLEPTPAPASTPAAPGNVTSVPTAEWGILEIRVTDPPPADVKSAVVYLTNIEVHKVSANVSDNESSWIPIIKAPASFDLMDVIGVEKILGSANITAGSFTQIRMDVTKVVGETTDNVSYTAEVPSDKLKIVGAFNVGGGTRTVLTLDFDGERSLVRTGQGKFLFKPVVKLLLENEGDRGKKDGGQDKDKGRQGQSGNVTE